MSIKDILPKKDKKDKSEYFWTLVIEPSWIQAGIWKIEEDSAHILADSTPTAWNSEDELVTTCDAALSSAVKKLNEMDDEPNKTVFGVVSNWVNDGEIDGEYLQKIKKVCEELDLAPVGFVVIPEAIAHYYKSQEGSPLSALVLGVFDDSIELTVFNIGEIAGKETVSRSVSIVDDLSEGLARLKVKKLPSRFIIYDGKEGELEEVRQSLLKTNWDSLTEIEIFHTPKIEILDSSEKVQAVSLAGASEMSEVSKILPVSVEDKNEDDEMQHQKNLEKSENSNVVEPEEDISPEDFGFVVEGDIKKDKSSETKTYVPERLPKETDEDLSSERQGQVEEEVQQESKQKRRVNLPSFGGFGKIGNPLKGFFGKRIILIGIISFILLFVGSISLWWYIPKASVTIYLKSQQLEENFTIFVRSGISEPDFSESILPGDLITKTVEGEKTAPATGVKVVGDKAIGKVIIYRVGSSLTLDSGTIVSGPNGLNFSLDETINIASGSAGSPGETAANVTAVDLGADYNLASGTSFEVGDYSVSDVEAKNEESFSGGSSREISAVSKEDRIDLQSDLEEELTKKALGELKEEINSNELLIEDSVEIDPEELDFNHDEGEEATTVKLNMSLNVKILILDRDALSGFAKELLEDKVPDGFVLRSEQIDSKFDYEGLEEEDYVLDVDVDANLLPEIETAEIKEKITGKYPFLAEEYLKEEIPGFVRAEIILNPSLPGRLRTLPHVSDNIEIEVASER